MLYVAGEILLWMVLAFALGLLVGWFVWGLRQRKAVTPAMPQPASSEVESVRVRPVPKATPAVAAAAAAEAELPVTPPAGQPAVPLAPPSTSARDAAPAGDAAVITLDDPVEPGSTAPPASPASPVADTATAEVSAAHVTTEATPAEATPADPAEPAPSPGLAALVAEGAPPLDPGATPAGGLPVVESVAPDVAEPRPAPSGGPDLVAGAQVLGRAVDLDDLQVVEGIGPGIEAVLHESGIGTWSDLAEASPERIRTLLDLAGDQYRVHDPATWPRQAGLAASGRWDELVALQATLSGGQDS